MQDVTSEPEITNVQTVSEEVFFLGGRGVWAGMLLSRKSVKQSSGVRVRDGEVEVLFGKDRPDPE